MRLRLPVCSLRELVVIQLILGDVVHYFVRQQFLLPSACFFTAVVVDQLCSFSFMNNMLSLFIFSVIFVFPDQNNLTSNKLFL